MTTKLAAMETQLKFMLSPEGMMMVDSATTPAQIVELLGRLGTALILTLPAVPVLQRTRGDHRARRPPLLIPGWPDYFGQASNLQALLDVFTSRPFRS